jgi:3-dehydroquinate synthase
MNSRNGIRIESGQGAYSVDFYNRIDELVDVLSRLHGALVVIDENVAELYETPLAKLFLEAQVIRVAPTEESKTIDGVREIWKFFQASNATKATPVIVIGGGIVQDLAQFASHNYYRGLRWYFVPTTLLAQADSCIGAKCGINFGSFKNQLGVFHAPTQVLICHDFLNSLSESDIRSGYGEIVKLHLTRNSPEMFFDLKTTIQHEGWRCTKLEDFVRQSLEIKRGVIEEDEYEYDLRRILNYGHTFGHSLETMTGYEIPHGISVAWGIDLVNYIAMEYGLITEHEFNLVHELIVEKFAWRLSKTVSAQDLVDGTKRDKKIAGGKIYLIVPSGIGQLRIMPFAYDDKLTEIVTNYLKRSDVLAST